MLAYLLVPIAFVAVSYFLFYKTVYAPYIYTFAALMSVFRLSEGARNDFLKNSFFSADYTKLRLIENGIVALPFCLFLLFKGAWLFVLALIIGALVLAIFQVNNRLNYSIPTPFGKHPFEFATGFRLTILLVLLAYFLTYMAIAVDNFNLGIFNIFFLFAIAIRYYSEPETSFFAWVFAYSPQQFLGYKLKIMLLYFTLLCLPVILSLCLFFPAEIGIVLALQVLVSVYLLTVVLAKYATFPKQNSVPEALLLTFGFLLPPLLLGLIPYFYRRAIRALKPILL